MSIGQTLFLIAGLLLLLAGVSKAVRLVRSDSNSELPENNLRRDAIALIGAGVLFLLLSLSSIV